jgi:hypothetical protein
MIDSDQDYQGNYWDGDPDDPPECDHDDADFDILDGRMTCHCGYSRYLTGEEIDAELHRMSEYDRLMRRQTSPWRQMYDAVRGWLWSLTHRPARQCAVASDDEIPF